MPSCRAKFSWVSTDQRELYGPSNQKFRLVGEISVHREKSANFLKDVYAKP